ncbi:MAG: protein phosphatase 2C domain-containing protein [Nocardioides sp.]|uniref:PP2C family protein-serine/threonine phosphatase n=1 Tax=Nocardioides sp. TaxID=35761 RepID=UPI0039E5E57D
MLRFSYGARSDVGLVRSHNEDAGFAGPYLQLVADGVGGAAAGEVAAATTAYLVSALTAASPEADPVPLLAEAVRLAQHQLQDGVRREPERHGMATTLVAGLARHGRVTMVHIGDSRGYLLRDGALIRLTRDHTLVQLMIDQGRLTPDEARTNPYRSVVVKSVNADQEQPPDLWTTELRVGDRLLLCSDGLSDFVEESEIATRLATPDPDEAAESLVAAALAAGGRDNVTCLVSDLIDGPPICADGRLLGAMANPELVIDPAAIRLSHSA